MTTGKPIAVLLVDDHAVVREGLKLVLARDPQIKVVGEAGTADAAIAETKRLKPDVILMDIRLPGEDGVQACSDILEQWPQTRVLFLTSFADDDTVLAAVLAGAHGYLIKEIGVDTLVDSISGWLPVNPSWTRLPRNGCSRGSKPAVPLLRTQAVNPYPRRNSGWWLWSQREKPTRKSPPTWGSARKRLRTISPTSTRNSKSLAEPRPPPSLPNNPLRPIGPNT